MRRSTAGRSPRARRSRTTDTNYKRVLDCALTPEHTHAVKIGVAGHNLFDIAYAWLLAEQRGGRRAGSTSRCCSAWRRRRPRPSSATSASCCSTRPVVHPAEFDVAIAYLIRRLEENASTENFMSAVFELDSNAALFEREKQRFLASVAELAADPNPHGYAPLPNRRQDRTREWEDAEAEAFTRPRVVPSSAPAPADAGLTSAVLGLSRGSDGILLEPQDDLAAAPAPAAAPVAQQHDFHNAADTDPSLAANRAWGRKILARVAGSQLGADTIAAAAVNDAQTLELVVARVQETGAAWGRRSGFDRAAVLDRAGLALSANRDRLIEVMAAETGKTIAEADTRSAKPSTSPTTTRRVPASSTPSRALASCRRS